MSGGGDYVKSKKSKKSKKKRHGESASNGQADGYSKTDKARRGAAGGGGRRRVLMLLLLALAAAAALFVTSRGGGDGDGSSLAGGSGGGGGAASGEDAAKLKAKAKKKAKKQDGEGEDEGEDDDLKMSDVNVIQSEHGNLGWHKLQGPLVTKRPPRECSIKRIQPQMTSPFYVVSKKDKWKRRIHTCLRFGKKACPGGIMDDFVARRWKLKATSKKPLEDRILSTFVLTDSLTLGKLQQSKPEVFAELYERQEGSTYLNALLGGGGLDGGILEQHATRAAFAKHYGCSFNALKVQPPQFRYDVSAECGKMEKALSKHPADSWVLWSQKDAAGSSPGGKTKASDAAAGAGGGAGSTAGETSSTATTAVLAKEGFCADNARFSSARDSRVLASLVVKEPLKLEGKLFDVRSYILVGSTMPMMVFFQQGYIRQAGGGSSGRAASPFFFDGDAQPVPLARFQEHMAKDKITGSHYVDTFLQSSMKQIALFVFHAARRKIRRRRGSYQLYSVDYVVDKSFRIYLEKTGGHPELEARAGFDPGPMVADMHDLVMELHEVPVAFESMVKGDKYGTWELIFSELRESCHRIVYNPCHLFIDFNDKELTKQNRKVGRVQATAKRLENEQKRIVKKTEEKKKAVCRDRKVPYPGQKCNKLLEEMDHEEFNALFAEHEQSFNPNEFRLPKPGEVFPHEMV